MVLRKTVKLYISVRGTTTTYQPSVAATFWLDHGQFPASDQRDFYITKCGSADETEKLLTEPILTRTWSVVDCSKLIKLKVMIVLVGYNGVCWYIILSQ